MTCLIVLAVAVVPPQAAGGREPDKTCGRPGPGAFDYVQVWNVSCRTAFRISERAGKKFCGRQYRRCDAPKGEFDSGRVSVRQWNCEMRVGYEYYRARCYRDDHNPRFVHRSGA